MRFAKLREPATLGVVVNLTADLDIVVPDDDRHAFEERDPLAFEIGLRAQRRQVDAAPTALVEVDPDPWRHRDNGSAVLSTNGPRCRCSLSRGATVRYWVGP